jgi:hypothetical protein
MTPPTDPSTTPDPDDGKSCQTPSDAEPKPASAPGFATDVKSLFRPFDQSSMLPNGIDLWDYSDVKSRAQDIYDQVSTGNMPCDEPWTQDMVDTFKAWMDGGYLP